MLLIHKIGLTLLLLCVGIAVALCLHDLIHHDSRQRIWHFALFALLVGRFISDSSRLLRRESLRRKRA